jgi:DNA segregation ATPase FtsK/SpoIIIE-like protein
LPHSFALLGTSGGGKSNTLNHILFSIFYNFETVYELNFIDFKVG